MVRDHIAARGVGDPPILEAMRRIPRERFVPGVPASAAYGDHPLAIGAGQTISQPYIVALMTDLLDLEPGQRILEIGTGSGYQAAVLAELVDEVYSIENVPELADQAKRTLQSLGYERVHLKCGNGYRGWARHAPFDGIILTAAPPFVPPLLLEQLAPGGRMVLPLGRADQELVLVKKRMDGSLREKSVLPVSFVPMTDREGGRAIVF